jgi:hypothetical protein
VALPVNRSLGCVAGVVGFALAIAAALGVWYAIQRWYTAGPFLPARHTGRRAYRDRKVRRGWSRS